MPRDNDHALTLRLPDALYQQLRARAEEEDRTVAWLLRRLARQYLDGKVVCSVARAESDRADVVADHRADTAVG